MIEAGTIVRHWGRLFSVVEVRGDRLVLRREDQDGPPQIALVSAVEEVVAQPRMARRSIFDDGVA